MAEVQLTISSSGESQIVPLTNSQLTIGRGERADIKLSDQSLSRLHASLHREGDNIWVLDEGSLNGSFVNGQPVAGSGKPLRDGDRITLGNETEITVTIARLPTASTVMATNGKPSSGFPFRSLVTAAVLLVGLIITVAIYAWQQHKPVAIAQGTPKPVSATPTLVPTPPEESDQSVLETVVTIEGGPLPIEPETGNSKAISYTKKRYQQMSESERISYLNEKVQDVGRMIGTRSAAFPKIAITSIKVWVDAFARRIGNGQKGLWRGDLNDIFQRARMFYTPTIIAAFQAHKAPIVVGVYLPFIETEYTNLKNNNPAGAAGLFQFLGSTAKDYGVDPSERTNIEKMAPAAARYINHRMNLFGADAVGVGLSIAGYNRNPEHVREDLHRVINRQNPARDFWNLVKNKTQLDHWFQDENINYVPRFFAAAIIGENPRDFGLAMEKKLSTCTEVTARPEEMSKPH